MAFNLADVLKDVSKLDTGREQIEYISLTQIDEDPNNFYQLSDIPELADNIALCGLQQPIRVRQKDDGRYIIVSGHRRRAALEMLVADGYEKWREAPCVVEQDEASPALQQLRLIYANSNTRKMTSAEISEQALQVEKLLYQLKEDGFNFPGRMRDHVAEAVQVSKTKLARLKVIRENLEESWTDDWKGGTLTESQAYELAQMPKYWQSIIKDGWGQSIQSLYADRIRLFHDKFQELADIQCQHGLQLCEHSSKMMRKNAGTYYNFPCNRCCFDCYSLQTCKDCCPEAAAKKKELKAVAKQANLEAKREQEEKDRPAAEFARMVWDRIGKARKRSGCSVEKLYKAQKKIYSASIDSASQEKMEKGKGTYGPTTSLPFGYSAIANDMMKVVAVADALQCSVDYLLGRTDDRESHLSNPVPQSPVSNSGTVWRTGDPAEQGSYILLLGFPPSAYRSVEHWDWDEEKGWHDDTILLDIEDGSNILGWIPMPKDA